MIAASRMARACACSWPKRRRRPARQATAERRGRTREGRQYLALALADLKRKDYLAAERNLRTALTFEPGNELFKEQLAAVRKLTR